MGNSKTNKLLILLLMFMTVVAVGVAVWAVCFRDDETVLAPDRVPTVEENSEEIPGDSDEKMDKPEGGGSVSITYSKEVEVDLQNETVELIFGNPGKSNMDMVLQVVIQDNVIVQTGSLKPGNQINTVKLLNGAKQKLTTGIYEGKFNVLYYDLETGEKAIVNTEIPVTITVY